MTQYFATRNNIDDATIIQKSYVAIEPDENIRLNSDIVYITDFVPIDILEQLHDIQITDLLTSAKVEDYTPTNYSIFYTHSHLSVGILVSEPISIQLISPTFKTNFTALPTLDKSDTALRHLTLNDKVEDDYKYIELKLYVDNILFIPSQWIFFLDNLTDAHQIKWVIVDNKIFGGS